MYDFVTHTWNIVKGACSHNCAYCNVKKYTALRPLRFDTKEMNTDLGEGNFIFVGSSTDMFANDVPDQWIEDILAKCRKSNNKFLFQSKNPKRFLQFIEKFPKDTILASTIETNRHCHNYDAPSVRERAMYMKRVGFPIMITVEPVIDFDIEEFIGIIADLNPWQLTIGADSQKSGLKEPSGAKLREFIARAEKYTTVIEKPNLKRLLE